ncbi:sensor histidine kinase, partial [Leucobacter sp. M11]|uniref:sensor histidine kinase n=1 Tax=Leucobacter sp. M11 TaxID=2993565 RepID=UPI002D7F3030
KGVAATWWYTILSAQVFALALLFFWSLEVAITARHPLPAVTGFAAAGVLWLIAFTALTFVFTYHRTARARPAEKPTSGLAWLLAGLAATVALGLLAHSVTLSLSLGGTLIATLPIVRGVRGRLLASLSALILFFAWLEHGPALAGAPSLVGTIFAPLLFTVLLPAAIISMLWWWEVVGELDRARAAEGRLAATQERLRLAADVHDLQGHHLQVIALQLELAERLLPGDPQEARAQILAAQRSVDEARTGTRDLATRFRGVPLVDELSNAADLLRSAGLRVRLDVAPSAERAPAEVFGPIVREATTNILKHGAGGSARLSLRADQGGWHLRIENDRLPGSASHRAGSGLGGMAERVERVGGSFAATEQADTFAVQATVPEGSRA